MPSLQRDGEVEGDAVEESRYQDQSCAEGGRAGPVRRGPADGHHPNEPDDQTRNLDPPRQPPQDHGCNGGGEQRRGPVQHPRQRRVDPSLREWKQQEGNRHPDDPQQGDGRQVASGNRPASTGHHREGRRTEQEAQERHQGGREMVQADRDEQER